MSSKPVEPIRGEVVPSIAGATRAGSEPDPSALPGRFKRSVMEERSGAFWVGTTFGALLALSTTLLIVQNSESANLDWLWLDFSAPLWLLLFLSAVSGAILAVLTPPIWRRARNRNAARAGTRGTRTGSR